MENPNNRYVVRSHDGWCVKDAHDHVCGHYATQEAAISAAKVMVRTLGGGEVRIQGVDGRWRDSDTVAPGRDPFPPRDMRH